MLFTIKEEGKNLQLYIDGPDSILDSTRSYGINFCNLLPAILLIEGNWEVMAKIKTFQNKEYDFQITPDNNYKSFYKKNDFLRQQKVEDLIKNWDNKNSSIKISQQIFSIEDNFYLLPDIETLNNKKEKFYFEWVKYPLSNNKVF